METLFQFLSWISVPALHLKKINISLIGRLDRKVQSVPFNNPFSPSPITEACLERIPYPYLPISLVDVQKFHVYSYHSLEIYNILQQSRHLTEVVITPAPPSVSLNINPLAVACARLDHISLRQLSFVLTRENARQVTKIPVALDYLTLPALQKFHILTLKTELLPGILPGKLEPVEYSRIVNLLHRSECNLTEITFSVPVPVNNFLIPILKQSPALQNLDTFVDTEITGGVFRVLTLSEGNVPNLKTLRIEDVPCGRAMSGLLHEGDAFHEMVTSRLAADNRLERLRISLGTKWFHHRQFIPVAQNSRIRNLLKMKEEGLDVEFLLDRTDCLIEGDARHGLFGSM
ncbi:uncharacterized protein EV420DRAFT_1476998 [Desarmillaria tabescens]|uniref:Uncharacterized protein n=1 Tax=Armillaria tabescens TaxID=1929756 RepID=A0AA39NB20_ARMTA|nr:uncharacterized protein EV420DRAFT_1476998 [Desarmillaria tabescens]KAK0462248.1 hypothetical protein EV420DRAFT_1476998 [Desarmillaria tabescens]